MSKDPQMPVRRAMRRAKASIANAIRNAISPEEIVEFLARVAYGETPANRAGQGSPLGVGDASSIRARPTTAESLAAMKLLLEHGWGAPPQRIQIEAEVRSLQAEGEQQVDLTALTMDELKELRRLKKKARGVAPIDVLPYDPAPALAAAAEAVDPDGQPCAACGMRGAACGCVIGG